jgi:hypothetical protein
MGNNINTAKTILKKPSVQKSAGEDIMTYFENIKKTVESHNKSQTSSQSTSQSIFKKYLPSSISQLNLMSNNKLRKVDSYIKSPTYMQRYKLLQLKAKNIFDKFNTNVEGEKSSKILNKFPLANPFSLARDITKKKLKRIIMYFGIFVIVYTFLKYLKYKFTYRNRLEDHNLGEMLKLVSDLRKQNEDLIKHNKELVDKLLKGK